MHPGQGCWRWHLSFFKAAPSPLSCSSCWTVEEQTYLLPLHSLTPVGERVCSNLPACSSQHKGTCSSQFCATLLRAPGTHSLHCFQVKLNPGVPDICLCLYPDVIGLFLLVNCSWVQSIVGKKKPDWTFCAVLLLECIVFLFLDTFLFFFSDLASFFWYMQLASRSGSCET